MRRATDAEAAAEAAATATEAAATVTEAAATGAATAVDAEGDCASSLLLAADACKQMLR
jgi:hypothetical protein